MSLIRNTALSSVSPFNGTWDDIYQQACKAFLEAKTEAASNLNLKKNGFNVYDS